MNQLEFFEVPSPCVGVCQSGPRGYCLGCFRSREERLHWRTLEEHVKRTIVRACYRRRLAANRRKPEKSDLSYLQQDLLKDQDEA